MRLNTLFLSDSLSCGKGAVQTAVAWLMKCSFGKGKSKAAIRLKMLLFHCGVILALVSALKLRCAPHTSRQL